MRRTAVMELIGQSFKIKLPLRTDGAYWVRWGYTPKNLIKKLMGTSKNPFFVTMQYGVL